VALKLDRLFRDAADALSKIRQWDKADVALHLVDMGGSAINTASAMGRMMLTILAGFAEWERNVIAERTAAVLWHKKQGHEVYGVTPLGYQRAGDRLVADADELQVVARIQAMKVGGASMRSIAAALNDDQVPTKQGKRWYASTIRGILGNSLYQETM
jgi:DNA invertase Pin-like site-specific DNA recombinase